MPLTKPLPVLRIGVTGARTLNPEHSPLLDESLQKRIDKVLWAIRAAASAVCHDTALRLLSPLAEGADRLVAARALGLDLPPEHRYALVCPLPFHQATYEQAFPHSIDEFRGLLAHAKHPLDHTTKDRILELDGEYAPEASSTHAYEAVGRLIVRNTDLIIGIWDGKPSALRGGTAETIDFAARKGPPVIWIHATDAGREPAWIEDEDNLPPGEPKPDWERQLKLHVWQLLREPQRHPPPTHSNPLYRSCHWLHEKRMDRKGRRAGCHKPTPAEAFLDERPRPLGRLWRTYSWMIRLLDGDREVQANEHQTPAAAAREPDDPQARLWHERFRHADQLASEHAGRYRSSYVLAFTAGALALILPALIHACEELTHIFSHVLIVKRVAGPLDIWGDTLAVSLEILCLVAIVVLIGLDGYFQWQRRAIEYRLLAELCRKQEALAPLGWALPRADTLVVTQVPDPDDGFPERGAWVVWLFGAWLRATPLAHGVIDERWVTSAGQAAERDLIGNQIAYHKHRAEQYQHVAHKLEMLSFLAFMITVFFLFGATVDTFPLRTHSHEHSDLLRFVASMCEIPTAFSAAFFGIRAYAEFETLAEQSEMMGNFMKRANQHIKAALQHPHAPLASQHLGSALSAVAARMMEDLRGWDSLFRAKILDT
jgi:hypothetical protein